MSMVEERLGRMGYALPPVPQPVARYVPAKRCGDLVLTAGQIPVREGSLLYKGRLGEDLSVEQGVECARQCVLNALAAVKGVIGDLDQVGEVLQVRGFVSSVPGFEGQARVMDGASQLLADLFGERGLHVRSAVGVASLPLGAPVEVELVVRVRTD